MTALDLDEFNKALLTKENPFWYPAPPKRPPFMVGGEEYLRWFKDTFVHSIGHGYVVSFVVGQPGAGKSHFLSYLDHLFYEKNSFDGVYSIFEARREEIDESDLWRNLLWTEDAVKKLRKVLTTDKIETSNIRSDIKGNLTKLLEGTLQIESLPSNALHEVAVGLSELLVKENAGICLAIDNVDEHFRFLSDKYGKEKALERFFGTLRSITTGLKQIVVLLACTSPVYEQIKAVEVDRTFARRIEYREEMLKELSLGQAFEIVHSYMEWWAKKQNLKLPLVPECCFETSSDHLSLYPFSRIAVEYFHKVTSQFAGDIVFACCELVDTLKSQERVSIIKDEIIIFGLENAAKKRPQIISKTEILKTDRARILEKLMTLKLIDAQRKTREKYISGITSTKIIESVESYARILGIGISAVPSVPNFYNPARWVTPEETLKIWEYKGRKIIEFIIGDQSPIGTPEIKTYSRYIEPEDVIKAASFIESGHAAHILYLLHWSGSYSRNCRRALVELIGFEPISAEMDLEDVLLKIIAAIEEGGDDRKDLIEHVEKYYVKLIETLDILQKQERPPEKTLKQRHAEIRRAYT
jgi:hypothetical protein